MIREVLRMGDPRLLGQARPVIEFDTPALHGLIADMLETMRHHGGVGLAAPQIGIPLRVVVFGFETSHRYPDAKPIPQTILINPEWTPLSTVMEDGNEGCLSLPGLRGMVPRWKQVRYAGMDERGNRLEREVSDFYARVIQHECDHLDGILYPMRIRDFSGFGFVEIPPDCSLAEA